VLRYVTGLLSKNSLLLVANDVTVVMYQSGPVTSFKLHCGGSHCILSGPAMTSMATTYSQNENRKML
jgi:hypothetical protein